MRHFMILVLLAWPAMAQEIKLDQLDHLAAKASETVNLTLDAGLLRMATKMMDDDSDSAEVKKLVSGLKGIAIRSFEFKNDGEYLTADVDTIRAQLKDPEWKRIVQVRSKTDGDSDVYLHTIAGRIEGVTIINAEPRQLTIVSIMGPIDAEGLKKLGGNFGIPKVGKKKAEKEKDE